jgi:vacuolar-type H+-ATPase subunit I/STV1
MFPENDVTSQKAVIMMLTSDKYIFPFPQGNEIFKTVVVAFFQGEQLKSRVKKVCAGFHASLYPCPNVATEREEMVKGVRTRLEDLNMVNIYLSNKTLKPALWFLR